MPPARSRKLQVRYIDAGDEQHQYDGCEQDQQRRFGITRQCFLQGYQDGMHLIIRVRILLFEPFGYGQ